MIQDLVKVIVLTDVCADLLQETLQDTSSSVDILKNKDDKDLIQQFLTFVLKDRSSTSSTSQNPVNPQVNPKELWKMLQDKLILELTKLCAMLPKVKDMEMPDVKKSMAKRSTGLVQTPQTLKGTHDIKTLGASVEPTFPSSSTSIKHKPKPKPHNDEEEDDEDEDGEDKEDWKSIHAKLVCHLKCVCCLMCKLEKLKPNDDKMGLKSTKKQTSIWQHVAPPKSDDDWNKTKEKVCIELKKVCCLMKKLEDMTPPDDKYKMSKHDRNKKLISSSAPQLTKQFEHHDQFSHLNDIVPELRTEHQDDKIFGHDGDEKKKDDINKLQSTSTTTNKKNRNKRRRKGKHGHVLSH